MAEQPPRIEDVIAAAGQPGHAQCKAVLGAVSGWLVRQGDAAGLDIAGFRHVIDTSAVRHIKNRHGNEKTEQARGQIAISDGDILKIPLILSAPDQLIFGAQTPRRQPVIGYIKRLPDGALLFLQEVRAGRKHLSALSMRKYPAATLSGNIAATLESNGRTDGGTDIHIVDAPENVTAIEVNLPRDEIAAAIMNKHPATRDAGGIAANVRLYGRTDSGDAVDIADLPENIMATEPPPKPAWRRVIKFLPPVLGVLVLAGIIFGLHGALSRVSPRDVLDALAATSARQIYEAFGLLGVSFCIMMLYDWPGIFFAKKLISFPPIGGKHVALASFSAYALSHVLGAPAISGAAIRLRLYAAVRHRADHHAVRQYVRAWRRHADRRDFAPPAPRAAAVWGCFRAGIAAGGGGDFGRDHLLHHPGGPAGPAPGAVRAADPAAGLATGGLAARFVLRGYLGRRGDSVHDSAGSTRAWPVACAGDLSRRLCRRAVQQPARRHRRVRHGAAAGLVPLS